MTVELDQNTVRLIDEEVQAGRSSSAEELIRRAVQQFVFTRKSGAEYTPDEIEAKIARGVASLEHGEGVDGEQFFDTLEAELNAAEKARETG
jgi:Arc/MetJ-type ribon-helix-helix transcriptional regulator